MPEVKELRITSMDAGELSTLIKEALKGIHPPKQEEVLLTREDASEFLGITLPTLHSYSLSGTIKAYRIGRKVRYKKSELLASLKPFNLKS